MFSVTSDFVNQVNFSKIYLGSEGILHVSSLSLKKYPSACEKNLLDAD